MAETIKKAKPAAKPRKTATKKAAATTVADPITENHHADTQARTFSHEEVARLAHTYYKQRGGQHGHHIEDWFRAEQELRGRAAS